MFGLEISSVKKTLVKEISYCLRPVKDDIGNVPTAMQTSKHVTGLILGICEGYSIANNITKPQKLAIISDAVFEELFRRESVKVLHRVDQWMAENDSEFMQAYESAKTQTQSAGALDLSDLTEYAEANFEPNAYIDL